VPVAPYNARNTDDPKDIEYRVEARIDEHSEDVQLKQSTLDETYNRRSGVERTNDAVKDCGLGHVRARGRVHARAQVFLALCLRLVIAITNDERGDNPGSTVITQYENYSMTPSQSSGTPGASSGVTRRSFLSSMESSSAAGTDDSCSVASR